MERRRAAWLAGVVLAATACAFPQQSSDRAACVALFLDYDRQAQFSPVEIFDRRRDRERPNPALSRLAVQLVQNDCLTRARDLGNLDAVADARGGATIVDGGPPLGRRVAVHAGALTSEADAARAVAFFAAQGLRATSIGNAQLGRRVYVGPVTTEGALAEVIAVATEAGFVAPYAAQFFRF